MAMNHYRIHTPVAGHSELIGAVAFVNGTAECDAEPTAAPLAYFRAQGYPIEVRDEHGDYTPEVFDPAPPVDARAAYIAELEARNAALEAELEALTAPDPAAKAKTTKEATA